MPASLAASPLAYTLPVIEPERSAKLAAQLHLTPAFATLLLARGIDSSPALRDYLRPRYAPDPDARTFQSGEALVDRLVRAIREGEPILVHGDYDVDGICGAVIYHRALTQLGARVRGFLPSRFVDGYGVSVNAIASAKSSGIRVVLTADTGSQAYEAIDAAHDAGLDFCITDHHELGAKLPATPFFVNPRREDCTYPFKGLSGGGIALKIALAVAKAVGQPLDPLTLIPYATLSTIADVCPLTGENRGLVDTGLQLLQHPGDPGLHALVDLTRKAGTQLSARDLAFGIIPLLNAAGRLDHPRPAAELLLTDQPATARTRLDELTRLNNERKRIGESVLQQAVQQAEQQLSRDPSLPVLVVAAPQWHFGVAGIVAAKLVDRYSLPAIVLTQHQSQQQRGADNGPFLYTGSGRAPAGCSLLTAVRACREVLHHCGGHDAALGVGLEAGALDAFRDRLAAAVATMPQPAAGVRPLDGQLDPADISPQLLAELARMEPCGEGNRPAVFRIGPFRIESESPLGDSHRALALLDARDQMWRGVQFGTKKGAELPAGPVGIIGTPVRNAWKGTVKTEIQVERVVGWDG